MSTDPTSVVRAFFDQCGQGGQLLAALDAHVAPDAVWTNTGLPPAEGLEAIKGFMQSFIDSMGLDAMAVEYLAIAADGNAVVTERLDHFKNAAGEALASLPVAGTLVVENGKIVQWRDYFDPRPFLGEG